jgi:hypothetical protein
MSQKQECRHRRAIVVRSGTLRPDDRRHPYEAAWCPDCGAFREESATADPEPWTAAGR